MSDAISLFRRASEACDIDSLGDALAADVELVSPVSGRMVFRGREDVCFLLGNVYRSLRGLQWTDEVGDERRRVVLGETRIAGVRLTDAMVFDLDDDGLIRRISPHLRPWLATTVFAAVVGPKLASRPGVLRRSLQFRMQS